MEIRNNPSQNYAPAFGMALKKPERVLRSGVITEAADRAMAHFENTIYGGAESKLKTRALRQYKGNQQNNSNYNIEYIAKEDSPEYSVKVIDAKTSKSVVSYDQDTKFVTPADAKIAALKLKMEETKSPLMKKWYALQGMFLTYKEQLKILTIKPENLMPAPFKAAAQKADELNALALQREKNVKTVAEIFDRG